jgi:hypothetical protein
MLLKRYILQKSSTKGLLNFSKRSFSIFNNTKEVETVLTKFKKELTEENFKELYKISSKQKAVHLFKINGFTKAFFVVTRYQIMGYCIGGGLYTLLTIPEKWEKLNE